MTDFMSVTFICSVRESNQAIRFILFCSVFAGSGYVLKKASTDFGTGENQLPVW